MADDGESDFTSLPLDELIIHKSWKARQLGYNQLKQLADSNINDNSIINLLNDTEIIKKIASDSNLASQETGISTLFTILKNISIPNNTKYCTNLRNSLIPILVEKGLTSNKANTKISSTELILLFVEVDSPSDILELIIPSLTAKSPKPIIAAIKVINEIFKEFGCVAINPQLIIDNIPKMFAHSDKNVRSEATNLCVTLRSYIGESLDNVIFSKLKPIQQKDLTALFNKIQPGTKPNRLLLVEQIKIKERESQNNQVNNSVPINDIDIEMVDIKVDDSQPVFDPYEFEDPIDVLNKLPSNLNERLSDPVWKERVEILKEISPLFKVNKIQNDDYSYFISLMVGCLKDVNLQVVTLSADILTDLAKGLKTNFSKYISTIITPLLERTKEKKKSVLDSLINILTLCFQLGSFHELVEPIVEHMKHISPLVKVETMQYLVRCLKELTKPPNPIDVEQIMKTALKLVLDSQLPVRNSASEVIGTLMKVIGNDASKKYIEKIDKRHIKKIEQICNNAVVKIKNQSINDNNNNVNNIERETKKPIRNNEISRNTTPSLSQNMNNNFNINTKQSIPSKRLATSPVKDNVPNSKNPLTSKSLKASNINNYNLSTQQLQEFESLKIERNNWNLMKIEMENEINELRRTNEELMKTNNSLNNKLDDYHNKFTTMNLTLKSKETQILRLDSDIENARSKNIQLQQKVRMLENQLETNKLINGKDIDPMPISNNNNNNSNIANKNMDINTNVDISMDESTDINRRISILSIDSTTGEPRERGSKISETQPKLLNITNSSIYNFDDNDEGWIKATAITNDLKAKIQRMKARSRANDSLTD